jgi:hypothetical protein
MCEEREDCENIGFVPENGYLMRTVVKMGCLSDLKTPGYENDL